MRARRFQAGRACSSARATAESREPPSAQAARKAASPSAAEDYAGPGMPSNVELVRAAVALVEQLGCRPATIADAAAILVLPR